MAYHSPFHEVSPFLASHPPYQPYQNNYIAGFTQNNPIAASSQQIPYAYHPPTPAQIPWQHAYQQPQESYHDYLQNQPKPVTNTSLDDFLPNFQAQMRALHQEQEHYIQQEELVYQDYIQQQEIEAQKHDEELFAKQVALKEEQIRLLCVRLQELEAQAISHLLVQPACEGVTKPVIPSFSRSPVQLSKPKIPSFRGHSPANSIENPLQEPLSGYKQPSHLISSPFLSCQEPINDQNIQQTWQPSWTRYPGYEMPNLVKDTPCELVQSQEAENKDTTVHSVPDNRETTVEEHHHLRQQVFEQVEVVEQEVSDLFVELPAFIDQDDEHTLLAIKKETNHQKETVMFFFDELPLFVEQEENTDIRNISIHTLQQRDINDGATLDRVSTQDMGDDEVLGEEFFDSIIEYFCKNLGVEISGCEPVKESPVLENTILVKNVPQVDSLDKLLNYLTEDDGPLTEGEELAWQAIMQGSQYEQKKGASRVNSKFVTSRGCPIRHLVRMEANNEGVVAQAAKHDSPLKDEAEDPFAAESEQFQLIPPVLGHRAFDQLDEVSAFAYIFQDMVYQLLGHLPMFHVFLAVVEYVFLCKLRRKGRYFSEPVNGFV